jgi:hypothetical protein
VWDERRGGPIRPEELPADCVNAESSLARTAGSVPAALAAGARTHADIAAGWGDMPAGRVPALHAVFARGHATPAEAVLAGGRLRVAKRDAWWLAVDGWAGGDGTVPAYSAVPVELSGDTRVRVPRWERHGPMGSSEVAVRLVREFEMGSIEAIRGGTAGGEGDPGITLDLDEFSPAGAPVTATLRNVQPSEAAKVVLRVRPAGLPPGPERRWVEAPMKSGDGVSWRADLPAAASGTYELRVEATGLPTAVPPASDLVDVVDEQEGGAEGREREADL